MTHLLQITFLIQHLNLLNFFRITRIRSTPQHRLDIICRKAEKVNISIYNSLGQKVRILENGYQQAGSHTVQWDSKDEHGISLSSGLYICHLQTYGYSNLIKLMLLK